MIEIMQRELLTLTDEILENLDYDGTLNTVLLVDRDEYSIEYKISVSYDIERTNEFSRETPPEQIWTRNNTGCTGRITIFDDGTEISKSGWEDLTEFMNQEITHYEL